MIFPPFFAASGAQAGIVHVETGVRLAPAADALLGRRQRRERRARRAVFVAENLRDPVVEKRREIDGFKFFGAGNFLIPVKRRDGFRLRRARLPARICSAGGTSPFQFTTTSNFSAAGLSISIRRTPKTSSTQLHFAACPLTVTSGVGRAARRFAGSIPSAWEIWARPSKFPSTPSRRNSKLKSGCRMLA